MPLLEAATAWYADTYQVQLDPATEALALVGSQEGLAHLLVAVADPGDGILMTDVAYPSYFGAGGVTAMSWLTSVKGLSMMFVSGCRALHSPLLPVYPH